MAYGDRKSGRVDFERGIPVYMMGIDGTWRRDCMMIDVSQTGARLRIEGSLVGLDLKEFFLLLSSTGLAYLREASPGRARSKNYPLEGLMFVAGALAAILIS
jgi:hypothetical protein